MSVTGISQKSAGDLRTDFLNLMVAQMRNQNPLEPLDNSQMTTQLAQLSQLEQLENLNSQFAQALASQRLAQASDLLGKDITFRDENDNLIRARVQSLELLDGAVYARTDRHAVGLDSILAVTAGA